MKEEKIQVLIEEALKLIPHMRRDLIKVSEDYDFKLTPHEHLTINIIAQHSPISMSNLALRLGVSNQQMTRIVSSLADTGLVERTVDSQNRRLVLTQLSEQGKKVLTEVKTQKRKTLSNILATLTESDIEQCIYHLQELNKIMAKLK